MSNTIPNGRSNRVLLLYIQSFSKSNLCFLCVHMPAAIFRLSLYSLLFRPYNQGDIVNQFTFSASVAIMVYYDQQFRNYKNLIIVNGHFSNHLLGSFQIIIRKYPNLGTALFGQQGQYHFLSFDVFFRNSTPFTIRPFYLLSPRAC